MQSKAILVVLLAAPCVVESAAALPKAVLELTARAASFAVEAAALKKPLAARKKGLLAGDGSGYDADTCLTDVINLYSVDAYTEGAVACTSACSKVYEKYAENMMAGTSVETSCYAGEECVAFKKTCASEAPSGWWTQAEMKITIKDFTGLKDSTGLYGIKVECYPASCKGKQLGTDGSPSEDVKLEKQAKPFELEMSDADTLKSGMSMKVIMTVEQMPASNMMMIIIIVAVLALCLLACLIRTGRCKCCCKCCPQGADTKAAPYADKVQVKEAKSAAKEGM